MTTRFAWWVVLGAITLGAVVVAWSVGRASSAPVALTVPAPLLETAHMPDAAQVPPLPEAVRAALATADDPVVAWTFHAGGRLEPCGCAAGMHGGLVRRASLLRRVAPERVLIMEGGGWNAGRADYQLVRSERFLDGLRVTGCRVVGLGAAEAALGAASLTRLITYAARAHHTGGPTVVCANLYDVHGQPVAARWTTVMLGARRIAVTAVLDGGGAADLRVGDAVEALLAIQQETHDPLLVLADGDAARLEALARSVPGLWAVIGGAVMQPSPAPVSVGTTRVVFAGNEGKTVGWWMPTSGRCAFELIDDHIADHPALRQVVRTYQEQIAAMDLQLDERINGLTTLSTGGGTGAAFVGTSACLACHPKAGEIHAHSLHARALATLVDKNYQHDPDCLRCHVTGFGLPDGWRRRTPVADLAAVGCEACHGRGSIHVAERREQRPSSGSLMPVTPASCTRCHDPENSPRFDFATYWKRISHDAK